MCVYMCARVCGNQMEIDLADHDMSLRDANTIARAVRQAVEAVPGVCV